MSNPEKTAKALRAACEQLRRSPMPIADIIPLLQLAADQIDLLVSAVKHGTHPAPPLFDSVLHIGPVGYGPLADCPCHACRLMLTIRTPAA